MGQRRRMKRKRQIEAEWAQRVWAGVMASAIIPVPASSRSLWDRVVGNNVVRAEAPAVDEDFWLGAKVRADWKREGF